MDVKITSVIIGVCLGSFLSWIGYVFKTRSSHKERVNTALFHLLEIWSVMGVIKLINEDKFANKLINEIKTSFPKENIDLQTEVGIKNGFEQSLPIWLGITPEVKPDYLSKYNEAISELAPIYPIYAFELNKNQLIMNFLNGVDSLFADKGISEQEKPAVKKMKAFLSNDAFNEFQADIKKLAKMSGLINYWRVIRHINKAQKRLNQIPRGPLKEYIDKVIAPMIHAHYENLGIDNPNISQ